MSMIDERRKSQRTDVDEMAYISASGSSTRCRIANGAALDVPDASYIPNCFHLMMERDRLVRSCRIVWVKQNRIGVEFERALEEQSPITQRERQFLQYLRDGGWRRAATLPSAKLQKAERWQRQMVGYQCDRCRQQRSASFQTLSYLDLSLWRWSCRAALRRASIPTVYMHIIDQERRWVRHLIDGPAATERKVNERVQRVI
jgi:hypothetical protein